MRTPSTLAEYPIRSGVYLNGKDTIDSSWPVYCDHYHLYSFGYETVSPQGNSDDTTDLSVWGWSLIGFPGPDMCSYTDWLSISTELPSESPIATSADQFAFTCGYYAQYEWIGDDDVYFEIVSMNAVINVFSVLSLASLTSFLF